MLDINFKLYSRREGIILWDAMADARNMASSIGDKVTVRNLTLLMNRLDATIDMFE